MKKFIFEYPAKTLFPHFRYFFFCSIYLESNYGTKEKLKSRSKKGFCSIIIFALVVSFTAYLPFIAIAGENSEEKKSRAVSITDEIIQMRSGLAQTFIKPDSEITEDIFKNVCGAVGKRVKEISEKEGFMIRHAALKNRNPANAAKAEEIKLLEEFDKNRSLKDRWDTAEIGGKKYMRYSKPIFVEDACLSCHGSKDKRPKFIIEKYPNDRAYDFKKGDLRGMIEVMFYDQ